MNTKQNPTTGLRGIIAGQTAICTCGAGDDLTYRGYHIKELANQASFEEVAYLLMKGELPSSKQLQDFNQSLASKRSLPPALKSMLKSMPSNSNPMDVLRSSCSLLGVLEPETSFDDQNYISERLLAALPSALGYWYQYSNHQLEIDCEGPFNSLAEHILTLILNRPPKPEEIQCLDASMILYAEHEFNASTFVCRVVTSTLSDFYSAITAAIGALRGPLHGGANEAAMALIEKFDSPQQAKEGIMEMLARKEKIMGFGHAVYKVFDPRSDIIKEWSRKLAQTHPRKVLFDISQIIDQTMKEQKKLFPNLDFYSASAYHFLGIKTELFTPLFVLSRLSGWSAHIFEQRADNKLIRPNGEYIGHELRKYVKIADRD